MSASKEEFFKPGRVPAQEKARVTDATARGIIAAETSERDRKTERLRQLRLAQPVAEVEPKPAGKKKR
jgi:hypothetical protein